MSGPRRGGTTGVAIVVALLVALVLLVMFQQGMSDSERRNQAAILASVTDGLAAADALKSRIAGYRQRHGRLPGGATDLGLTGADDAARSLDRGLAVGDGGVITIPVRDAHGAVVGTVRLAPLVRGTASRLQWHCTTSDFRNIRRHVPQCRYQKPATEG